MEKLKLLTTYTDIDLLSKSAFNARDKASKVNVDLLALKHIVMDHAALVALLKGDLAGHV